MHWNTWAWARQGGAGGVGGRGRQVVEGENSLPIYLSRRQTMWVETSHRDSFMVWLGMPSHDRSATFISVCHSPVMQPDLLSCSICIIASASRALLHPAERLKGFRNKATATCKKLSPPTHRKYPISDCNYLLLSSSLSPSPSPSP